MIKWKKAKKLRHEVKNILNKKTKITRISQPKSPGVKKGDFSNCPSCKEILKTEIFTMNLFSCLKCKHNFRLNPKQRISITFDSFTELFVDLKQTNPIELDGYDSKLTSAVQKTNEKSAVTVGIATIETEKFAVFIMNHEFIMGSLGTVVGEKIKKIFNYAIKHKLPVVAFLASGGARMQESMFSLMQMAKTASSVGKFDDEGLLYISILTTPTYGGVSASYGFLGDIVIAEENALIGFAGPNVIKDAMKIELPENFQTAEFHKQHGFVDIVLSRHLIKETIFNILKMHRKHKR